MSALSPAFPLSWSSETLEPGRTVLVTVEGELDRHTAPALGDHLQWLLASRPTRLILDTAAVSFADIGAIDLLAAIGRGAEAKGCQVIVTAPGTPVQRLAEIVGRPDGVTFEEW
jgi:anti-anti-sigma factor